MIYDQIEELSEQFDEEQEEKSKGKKKSKIYESNLTIEDFEKEVTKKTPKPKKSSSDGQGVAFSGKWSTVVPIGNGRYRDPDTGKVYREIKI